MLKVNDCHVAVCWLLFAQSLDLLSVMLNIRVLSPATSQVATACRMTCGRAEPVTVFSTGSGKRLMNDILEFGICPAHFAELV